MERTFVVVDVIIANAPEWAERKGGESCYTEADEDLWLNYDHWPERYSGRTLRFLNIFVSDILPLFLKKAAKMRRVRTSEERGRVTYALIPGVPELFKSLVETDGENEGAGENTSDEDACQGKREFSGIWLK